DRGDSQAPLLPGLPVPPRVQVQAPRAPPALHILREGECRERQIEDAMTEHKIDKLCIAAVRVLAMDAVQKANSGHPATPMAVAPAAYTLWTKVMKHNPAD